MKDLERFLQYSQKLEELQTARKAKEIDEICKFDVQLEQHKQRELEHNLKAKQAYAERLNRELNTPVEVEKRLCREGIERVSNLEEFERQAQHARSNLPGNDFDLIAELQGVNFGTQPYELKQLPAGSPDKFSSEVTELTEMDFQRELQQNTLAIHERENREPGQSRKETHHLRSEDPPQTPEQCEDEISEEKKDSNNVFFFRPPKSSKH